MESNKNTAIIDLEMYFQMRTDNEKVKKLNTELVEEVKKLKAALIVVTSDSGITSLQEPRYKLSTEDKTLIVTIAPTTVVTDRFNNVKVK